MRFADGTQIFDVSDEEDAAPSRMSVNLLYHRIYEEETGLIHLTGLQEEESIQANDPPDYDWDDSSVLSEMDEEAMMQLISDMD